MSDMSRIAALLGDPARANILTALMDGRALTAKELAYAAHVSPQTTSGHLAKLTDAQLLTVARQGRHRYFRLSSPLIGHMLESVLAVAGSVAPTPPPWRGGEALRTARTCYDHLAGRLGVAVADSLSSAGHLVLSADGGEVTPSGDAFLAKFGAHPAEGKRVFCRPCLDWSEDRTLPAAWGRRSCTGVWIWDGCSASATPAPSPSHRPDSAALPRYSGSADSGSGGAFGAAKFNLYRQCTSPADNTEISGGLLLPGAPRTAPIAYAATASA